MNYYKLTLGGTSWQLCKYEAGKKQINLYDFISGKMVLIGIGLY